MVARGCRRARACYPVVLFLQTWGAKAEKRTVWRGYPSFFKLLRDTRGSRKADSDHRVGSDQPDEKLPPDSVELVVCVRVAWSGAPGAPPQCRCTAIPNSRPECTGSMLARIKMSASVRPECTGSMLAKIKMSTSACPECTGVMLARIKLSASGRPECTGSMLARIKMSADGRPECTDSMLTGVVRECYENSTGVVRE